MGDTKMHFRVFCCFPLGDTKGDTKIEFVAANTRALDGGSARVRKGFPPFLRFPLGDTKGDTSEKNFFSHKTAHKHIFHVHRKRGGRRPPFSFPGTLRVPLYVTELLRSLIFRTAVLPAVLLLILS